MALPQKFPEPPADSADDLLAIKEAAGYASKDLEAKSAVADYGRSERLKSHLICAAIGLFWLTVFMFTAALVILIWHLLMPTNYGWLEPNRIAELRALVGGVVLSGAVSSFAKKYFK